jgi:hypothetical protein
MFDSKLESALISVPVEGGQTTSSAAAAAGIDKLL